MPRKSAKVAREMKQVIGYVRVSTDEQAKEGVSLQSQEMRIKALCVASGRPEPEIVIDDGQSAKNLKRTGLQAILEGVLKGQIGTVIVLKLDRLTRNVRDLGDLLELFDKHDCALVAVQESLDTNTASGRLMLNLLASVSQWEREVISERTTAAFDYKRVTKKAYGKDAPFGFERVGNDLIEVPHEIEAIRLMKSLQADGKSLRFIASDLESKGIRPSGGGKWYAQSVKAVLTSKMTAQI